MRQIRSLFAVDAHTTGTPIRIVASGIPPLAGATVTEKMEDMRARHDHIRRFATCPPRAAESLVAAVLTEPCTPGADFGLFYIDALTYQPMCGAGTFAVAKALIETGLVARTEPETVVRLETPTGIVTAYAAIEGGEVAEIALENVPAFLYRKDLEIDVPELGALRVDIGYGGNFFTLVDADAAGLDISPGNMAELRRLSRLILRAANAAATVRHPVNPDVNYMDQLLYCRDTPNADGEYVCQCIFGDAQADISPCGTGTSTRIAQRYFRGRLGLGETFRQKSVYGGVFSGCALRETRLGDIPAVVPRIACSDVRITAFTHLVAEADDRLAEGYA